MYTALELPSAVAIRTFQTDLVLAKNVLKERDVRMDIVGNVDNPKIVTVYKMHADLIGCIMSSRLQGRSDFGCQLLSWKLPAYTIVMWNRSGIRNTHLVVFSFIL